MGHNGIQWDTMRHIREKAIQILYLEYASKFPDSHLLRKFGSCKANAVMKMFRILSLKILRNPHKNFGYQKI